MALIVSAPAKPERAKVKRAVKTSTRWIWPVLVRAWNNRPGNNKIVYEPNTTAGTAMDTTAKTARVNTTEGNLH